MPRPERPVAAASCAQRRQDAARTGRSGRGIPGLVSMHDERRGLERGRGRFSGAWWIAAQQSILEVVR